MQTLAAIIVHRCCFPSGEGILFDGGNPSTADSMVGCIFGLRPQTASGTNKYGGPAERFRWCCCSNLWSVCVG